MPNLTIADWAEEDRPRERLEKLGASQMSAAELLAILIGSGSPGKSAVALMQQVLTDCHNSLRTLGRMSIAELTQYKGIGPAKAITILAACELGNRRVQEKAEERTDISDARDIYNYMLPRMRDLDVEEFHILMMNQNFKLIKEMCVSRGGITETAADVRIMLKQCLLCNATVLALCHNHPSGQARPSRADDIITDRIRKACEIMRVYLVDHVILTDGAYYSYREKGRL